MTIGEIKIVALCVLALSVISYMATCSVKPQKERFGISEKNEDIIKLDTVRQIKAIKIAPLLGLIKNIETREKTALSLILNNEGSAVSLYIENPDAGQKRKFNDLFLGSRDLDAFWKKVENKGFTVLDKGYGFRFEVQRTEKDTFAALPVIVIQSIVQNSTKK